MTEINDPHRIAGKKPKVHLSYEGKNRLENWSVDFTSCSYGTIQSPIDICQFKLTHLSGIIFNYELTKVKIIHNGYTIQVNPSNADNSVSIDDISYKLMQFHFHTPSEHTFNGVGFPMELHLVHHDAMSNLTSVGILIKIGAENQVLSTIWDEISTQKEGQEVELEHSIDLAGLLPKHTSIYRYTGSLTTPPYTEGVIWLLLEKPIEMSEKQIKLFKSIFPCNCRPLQPLNEREIIKYSTNFS